jgi:tetratricopeptide (TPR) repeat protein
LDPKSGYIKDWLGYWEVLTWAYHLLGDHEKELEEARRGLVQHPQRASALGNVIRALAALGRVEDLERGVDEYLALPPGTGYNPGRQMMMASNELRAHGFLEASKAMAARAAGWVENLPRDAGFSDEGRAVLAWARFNEEKWQESYALVEELHTRNPKNWGNLGWLGELAARRGDREEALRISKELENNSEPYTFGGPSLRRARIASVLGAKEEAIELIREALAKGQTVPSLHGVMAFECLRDYPPFKELIKPKG